MVMPINHGIETINMAIHIIPTCLYQKVKKSHLDTYK